MSLRIKSILIFGIMVVSMIALPFITLRKITARNALYLEHVNIQRQMERVTQKIKEELEEVQYLISDWAQWDDTCRFIKDTNSDYIQGNLPDEWFPTMRMSFIAFYNTADKLIYAKMVSPQTGQINESAAALTESLAKIPVLFHRQSGASVSGIIETPLGLAMVISHPIMNSKGDGPVQGTLMMGRWLNPAYIQHLRGLTKTNFELLPWDYPDLPVAFQKAKQDLTNDTSPIFYADDPQWAYAYAVLRGLDEAPIAILGVRCKKEITTASMAGTNEFLLILIPLAFFLGGLALWFLHRMVLRPIASLGMDVVRVTTDGDPSTRVAVGEADEVGTLSRQINEMLDAIEQSQIAMTESEIRHRSLLNNLPIGICRLTLDPAGHFVMANPTMIEMLGYDSLWDLQQVTCKEICINEEEFHRLNTLIAQNQPVRAQTIAFSRKNGDPIWASVWTNNVCDDTGRTVWVDVLVQNITEQRNLVARLEQTQKLETMGQLAAGIAHEINTPTQYISDNTRFLHEVFPQILNLIGHYHTFLELAATGTPDDKLIRSIRDEEVEIDLDYLKEEIPKAVEQSLEGLDRVVRIVRAMKEFSHPGDEDKTMVDLNRLLGSTITLSRNEWKYIADLHTDCDPDLPAVPCVPGDVNQMLLNMIINAAHAIEDYQKQEDTRTKGAISISTRQVDGYAEIRIQDSGCGISPDIQSKIFDLFFTTKRAGRGTGQGLAIARAVVVEKHGGTIDLESEPGKGTTFIIRLPLNLPTMKETQEESKTTHATY